MAAVILPWQVRNPERPEKAFPRPPTPQDIILREDGSLMQREDHGNIVREQ